jgi:hypothetical protein
MRLRAVTAALLLLLASAPVVLVPARAGADDTIFDFVAPRQDQQGAYQPQPGTVVAGGVGTLTAISGWLDEGWAWRRPVTVNNAGTSTLVEWPLRLSIDASSTPGASVFAAADPLAADLRVASGGVALGLMSRGVWNATENHGDLWFQAASLPPGSTTFDLYYGYPTVAAIDAPEAVFTYSTPATTRYLLYPGGATVVVGSLAGSTAWQVGGASGTLLAGELASVDSTMWAEGDGVASTGPIDVLVSADAAAEAAPLAFAATTHEVVINRGNPARVTFVSPLADTTVTVAVAGATVATVPILTGAPGEWVGTVAANSIVSLTAPAPIVASFRGDDVVDGFVFPPAATEVWGVRSGTPRIHAVGGAATVTVYDSSGATSTQSVPAGGAVALGAGGSGTGEAIRLVSTAPITVVANGDGDGGDAIVFHPVGELGRAWIVPTDGRFVIVAATGVGTTCTLTPPAGAPTSASASVTVTPPWPGRVMFGATTGTGVIAGSVVACDAPGFAYYEDAATDDERNLYPMESHRKRALMDPVVALGGPATSRYPAGVALVIDTPDLVAPTGVVVWDDFRVATVEPTGSNLSYLLSIDGGSTWLVPSGSAWAPSPSPMSGALAGQIGASMETLPVDTGKLRARVVLRSVDGVTRPSVDAIRVFYQPAGAPDRLSWDPLPPVLDSGATTPASLAAVDAPGNVLTGITGEITFTASHGGEVKPSHVTMIGGRASFDLAVLGSGDDITILAHGPQGLVGVSRPFDLIAPAGSRLELHSGDGQFGETGGDLLEPLTVKAVDPVGLPLAGIQVTFSVVDGGGSIDPVVATTGGDGLASTRLRLGEVGAQRVRADGLGANVTFLARADEPGATPPTESGCGCRAAARDASSARAVLLAGFALALWISSSRRRRGRARRGPTGPAGSSSSR